MSKFILLIFSSMVFSAPIAGPSGAAEVACFVPGAAVARTTQLCETLRVQMRVRKAEWSNSECASEFLRRGLRSFEASVTERNARDVVRTARRDALTVFDSKHPTRPAAAVCGDGIIDTEFGEACDDPADTAEAVCSAVCQRVAP